MQLSPQICEESHRERVGVTQLKHQGHTGLKFPPPVPRCSGGWDWSIPCSHRMIPLELLSPGSSACRGRCRNNPSKTKPQSQSSTQSPAELQKAAAAAISLHFPLPGLTLSKQPQKSEQKEGSAASGEDLQALFDLAGTRANLHIITSYQKMTFLAKPEQ